MEYQVQIQKKAKKQLNKIPHIHQEKFWKVLMLLARDPFLGKKLEGDLKGKYSVRVWPYRIIYRVEKKILLVIILDIGHRQGIY